METYLFVFMFCFIILSHLLEVYYWLQVEKVWSLQGAGGRAGRLRRVGAVWGTKAQACEGRRSRILLSFCFVQFSPLSQIFVYWTCLLTNLCEIQNFLFLETFSSRWKQAEYETRLTHAHPMSRSGRLLYWIKSQCLRTYTFALPFTFNKNFWDIWDENVCHFYNYVPTFGSQWRWFWSLQYWDGYLTQYNCVWDRMSFVKCPRVLCINLSGM